MAYENIGLSQSNFCLGPQSGTICTIDTTNPQTVLRIKSLSGSTIIDLSLSSNVLNDNIRLEYVGPSNLSEVRDALTFFTFEKVSDSSCMIKRWETRMAYRELLLKEEVVKYTTGNERCNAIDFAVEYYNRRFTRPNEYYNYLDMDNVDNIKTGTKLFIGPSTDTSNLGVTEPATVSHIINYINGKRVYLTAPLQYQYAIDDMITFYSYIYIYSSEGYANDNTKGTLFKLDAYTWSTVEIDTKVIYKRVTGARWCPMTGSIASIIGTNLLFVKPYDSYLNWQSLFMGNMHANGNDILSVYDIIFDNYSIYKLQKKITVKDDTGKRTTYVWDNYNMQADSLLPYSCSVSTWLEQSIVTGYNKNIDINIQVRDQYNIGLRDVYVNFYKEGDQDALFDPLSGAVTTDINGKAIINYRSGITYNGHTLITTRATGSSLSTGSSYAWVSNNIISYPNATPVTKLIFQLKSFSGAFENLKQLWKYFRRIWVKNPAEIYWEIPYIRVFGKSFFTTPGGDWGDKSDLVIGVHFLPVTDVGTYLPMLYRGNAQTDSPQGGEGYGFSFDKAFWGSIEQGGGVSGVPDSSPGGKLLLIANRITIVDDFDSEGKIKCFTDFLIYRLVGMDIEGFPPYAIVKHPDETGKLQISQLKLSLHTHWVDGVAYDELFTRVKINQFVFVEDAIPKFWSEKNPIDTNIWIRLRPFAFSLNSNTLRMWVRESSYMGDTGYYEVTSILTLANFDAGGGMLGIEALYNPSQDFLYGSLIFVRIEVYDTAYIPNFVYTEYWFKITPDYRAPYLINISPDREETNVAVDTTIHFEIMDIGTGVDVNSLECLLNSVRMDPNYLNIEVVSIYHIKVNYTPAENLFFSKDYKVSIKVQDTSPNANMMNASYKFYTADSTGVLIIDPSPGVCKSAMSRFQDVSVKVLADGNGVDVDSIRMQVFNKDVHPRILPIIYRIS